MLTGGPETTSEAPAPPASPAWTRLEDQIGWYDRKSIGTQRAYKRMKGVQIVLAALIPVLAAVAGVPRWALGALGALVAVIEGFQQLLQYQDHWITYRATCEALKHERHLFLAEAGPYSRTREPARLLAERVEGLVSQEHARWTAGREELLRREGEAAAA